MHRQHVCAYQGFKVNCLCSHATGTALPRGAHGNYSDWLRTCVVNYRVTDWLIDVHDRSDYALLGVRESACVFGYALNEWQREMAPGVPLSAFVAESG